MSKKCVCGHEMTPHNWKHELVCHWCGRKKSFSEAPSCAVFACRKCGHQLYVEETERFPQKLERIAGICCPKCGEQAEGLWQLLGRSDCFGGEIKVE